MNEIINRILALSKSYEEADFLRDIFGPFRLDAVSGVIPVVLFGAGSAGKEVFPLLKSHGVNPVCFCDNSPERQGTVCCGIPVVSPAELAGSHRDSLIVVTAAHHYDDIKKQLVTCGFTGGKILSIDEEALTRFYSHICLSHWTAEDLTAGQDQLLAAYRLMHDETSRQFFVAYLSLLTNGADYRAFVSFIDTFSDTRLYGHKVTESYLYFNNDIVDFQDGEVLLDCGAYNGDTALEFINACRKHKVAYKHIHCFEPEQTMFSELSRNTAACSNVSLNNCGLWTHSTTLSFVDTEIEKPGSTRVIRDSGDIHFSDEKNPNSEVCVISIDEQFPDDDITFVKMDIEGAEIEAIRGAEAAVRRCRPKLAISIYHKRNDIFEIPLLIDRICPGYKYYLRQFSDALSETVLFAIP